ncbi:MAG: fused DSP-PTPase phosphatase/NAD kinase-like protein [Pyrinomonadaceae bacterium]
MTRSLYRKFPAAVLVILALALGSFAQSNPAAFSQIKIKNFGQMDARFYRGAQPKKEDYKDLAALGVKTVIDLRDDAPDYERPAVEALGMHYVNIPMSDKHYPQEAQIAEFLKLAADPATGKFYVHCAGGRHRTGVMGAVYRYNFYHWNYDQVYKEMKDYDFYTRFGHGDMKKYVEDYWQRVQSGQVTLVNAAAVATH